VVPVCPKAHHARSCPFMPRFAPRFVGRPTTAVSFNPPIKAASECQSRLIAMHHVALAPGVGRLVASPTAILGTFITLALVAAAFYPIPGGFVSLRTMQYICAATMFAHALEGVQAYRAAAAMKLTPPARMGWVALAAVAGFGALQQVQTLADAKIAEPAKDK